MPRMPRKTTDAEDAKKAHAQERLRELIKKRGEELGHARGWKKQVAGEIGVTPEHLSRIVASQRGVSLETMERVAERLGFRSAYFFESGGPYTSYVEPTPHQRDSGARYQVRRLGRKLMQSMADGSLDGDVAVQLAEAVLSLPLIHDAERVLETPRTSADFRLHAMMLAVEVEMAGFVDEAEHGLFDDGDDDSNDDVDGGTESPA